MKQYEYFVKKLYSTTPDGQEWSLNHLGKHGWELVSVCVYEGTLIAYLKRELIPPQ